MTKQKPEAYKVHYTNGTVVVCQSLTEIHDFSEVKAIDDLFIVTKPHREVLEVAHQDVYPFRLVTRLHKDGKGKYFASASILKFQEDTGPGRLKWKTLASSETNLYDKT
jgi:hypothetical protein